MVVSRDFIKNYYYFLQNQPFWLNWCLLKDCRPCFCCRKFCSVISLKFKCPARNVCLDFLLDKNKYNESVWDWVFLTRFGKFNQFLRKSSFFLSNTLVPIFNTEYSTKKLPTIFCACILPLLYFCLQPSNMSVGGGGGGEE